MIKIEKLYQKLVNSHNDSHDACFVEIWQGRGNTTAGARIDDCKLKDNKLFLKLTFDESITITSNDKVYLICPLNHTLVKLNFQKIDNNSTITFIEDGQKLISRRHRNRINVEDRKLDINIDCDQLSSNQSAKLKDISESGCGFYITQEKRISFSKGAQILLNKIYDIQLHEPICGEIVHISLIETLEHSKPIYLIGVRFNKLFVEMKNLIKTIDLGRY